MPQAIVNMPSRQSRLQEDTDFRIMRILHSQPDMSQRELAAHLGISLAGLNYCLKALMLKGFIKLESFHNSKHKLKYMYVLTPSGIAQKLMMTQRFLKRKMEEYESLKTEIASLQQEVGNHAHSPVHTGTTPQTS